MLNRFCKMPLWEASEHLIACAQGLEPAELVILGCDLVNVCTGEIMNNTGVAITCGRIALVGDPSHCIGAGTKVIDADGAIIAPGFLDGHIHVESSMLSVAEYARVVVPHGTVGIYMDPHEICNVLGVQGVELMIQESRRAPLKAMVTVPSCVPAVPGFEDTGAAIDADDVYRLMELPEVVGLGEMMNYPGVLTRDRKTLDKLKSTLTADKIITGHYPPHKTENGLNAYIASGARCCHESTKAADALDKMRLGMYAQLREGSAWRDLHEVAKAVTENKIDTRFANLISDDAHPDTLLEKGHLDHILRRALSEGIDPIQAIQMVTINCASCFRMEHELGSITPGKCADIVFLESLDTMKVTRVIINGEVVAENGKPCFELKPFDYPAWATDTIRIAGAVTPDSFKIPSPIKEGSVKIRAIEIIPTRVGTYECITNVPAVNGYLESDVANDVLKTIVFERHKATGKSGAGFVKGFGISRGAFAQTVAHDAHNLMVIGVNDEDMSIAANALIDCGGGMCAVLDGKVIALAPLPVAGIISGKSADETAKFVHGIEQAWREAGCEFPSPFTTMSAIALACIPELRLTNCGLVDCRTFELVDLVVEESR